MTTTLMHKILAGGLIVGGASMALVGCVPGDDTTDDNATQDGFVEAIPNEAMLGLALGEEDAGQALTIGQAQRAANPSEFKAHAEEIVSKVNGMLRLTHARIDALIADEEPVEITRDGVTCKVWDADGQRANWRLLSCQRDARVERYTFLLAGRPLGSTNDDDFKAVVAGEATRLARHEGQRRGHGKIGYDLDNLGELTGEGPSGKVGIGFRAAGKARQLNIGLKNFQPENAEQDISALYSFSHVLGKGGVFKFALHADLLTREEGGLTRGQDGTDELGLVSIGWARDRAARAAAAVCGGTVGEGRCVAVHQCWVASGEVSYEEMAENADAEAQWEPTSCPDLRDGIDRAPESDELAQAPEGDDNIPAPATPEPSIDE